MKKFIISAIFLHLMMSGWAQEANNEESLGKTIEELTLQWDKEADKLNNYNSLHQFCLAAEYRNEIITLLNNIHHYDSVLYDRLSKAARFNKDREIQKTLTEIETFEKEYDMQTFLHFLHNECIAVKEIEKSAKETRNDIGEYSYDSQVYRVETELNKFIKQITKRMDHIRKHVHHLHIK